jgi:LmbE family N-acetylglucosaminyl deacetylase
MVSAERLPRIEGAGTPEPAWLGVLDGLAVLDLAPCRRAVVVAPHPDDETLAAGGLIARLVASGVAVDVVFVTDGEASHPRSSAGAPAAMRRRRVGESRAALAALSEGARRPAVAIRLHVDDGGVEGAAGAVEAAFRSLLRPGDWCVAPWEHDGHPDHEAAGRAARSAAEARRATFFAYPLWAWHWAEPAGLAPVLASARKVELPPAAQVRKEAAIACYESQIGALGPDEGDEAILGPEDLRHFSRPFEVLLT